MQVINASHPAAAASSSFSSLETLPPQSGIVCDLGKVHDYWFCGLFFFKNLTCRRRLERAATRTTGSGELDPREANLLIRNLKLDWVLPANEAITLAAGSPRTATLNTQPVDPRIDVLLQVVRAQTSQLAALQEAVAALAESQRGLVVSSPGVVSHLDSAY